MPVNTVINTAKNEFKKDNKDDKIENQNKRQKTQEGFATSLISEPSITSKKGVSGRRAQKAQQKPTPALDKDFSLASLNQKTKESKHQFSDQKVKSSTDKKEPDLKQINTVPVVNGKDNDFDLNELNLDEEIGNLMDTRLMLEQHYFDNLQEGRRMRKTPEQVKVLEEKFKENPHWDYHKKITIAEQIGMTFS